MAVTASVRYSLALAAALLAAGGALTLRDAESSPSAIRAVQSATRTARKKIRSAFATAARQARLDVDLTTLKHASGSRQIAGAVAIKNLSRLTLEDVSRGAIVGLVLLDLPSSTGIPVGFYRVEANGSRGAVRLLRPNGTVVKEVEASIFQSNESLTGIELEVGNDDAHIEFENTLVEIEFTINH